jgi:Putative auto-transporter adhesin, head GIN domain
VAFEFMLSKETTMHALASIRRLALFAPTLLLPMVAAHAAVIGSGKAATETREASGFAAITLRGSMDVIVRQGARDAVQVTADDNLLPLLQTTVEGSGDQRTLVIQWARGENVRTRAKAVVTVDVVKLTALASSGSGDMMVEALQTPALALSISGSSDARLNGLDTEQLRVAITGSGDVSASGKATRLSLSIAGSGDLRARDLLADDVSLSISGSGDASVQARKTLAISIAGSGDVEYSGAATITNSRIAGSGSVRRRP